MAEERRLISEKNRLTRQLEEINKRLFELEKEKEPWCKLQKKFESQLEYRPRITNTEIKSELQKYRIRLMEYLIENNHTWKNPISYRELADAIGLEYLANVLTKISNYSPLYGGLKVKNRKSGKKVYIEELYIGDMEKAKIYVSLMKELINLSLISN